MHALLAPVLGLGPGVEVAAEVEHGHPELVVPGTGRAAEVLGSEEVDAGCRGVVLRQALVALMDVRQVPHGRTARRGVLVVTHAVGLGREHDAPATVAVDRLQRLVPQVLEPSQGLVRALRVPRGLGLLGLL